MPACDDDLYAHPQPRCRRRNQSARQGPVASTRRTVPGEAAANRHVIRSPGVSLGLLVLQAPARFKRRFVGVLCSSNASQVMVRLRALQLVRRVASGGEVARLANGGGVGGGVVQ
jgi:hypothetical protein